MSATFRITSLVLLASFLTGTIGATEIENGAKPNNSLLLARATAQHLCGCVFIMARPLSFCQQESPVYEKLDVRLEVRFAKDTHRSVVHTALDNHTGISTFDPAVGCLTGDYKGAKAPPGTISKAEPWSKAPLPSGTDRNALDTALRDAFTNQKLEGTRALLVVHDGKIVVEIYAEGFDQTDRFMSHSIAKFFLGTIAGILVREEQLELDSLAVPDKGVTIRHLLTMTAGFDWDENYVDLASDLPQAMFGQGYADSARYAAARPISDTPGERYVYSSGNSILLAALLQAAIGADPQAFTQFVARELALPIGMKSLLMGFDRRGTFVASSWVFATARDYARLGQLHLNDGQWQGRDLLPDDWTEFMCTPTQAALDAGFGYGAHCRAWWPGEIDAYGHSGHEGQALVVSPSRRLVIVRFGNLSQEGYQATAKRNLRAIIEAFPENKY